MVLMHLITFVHTLGELAIKLMKVANSADLELGNPARRYLVHPIRTNCYVMNEKGTLLLAVLVEFGEENRDCEAAGDEREDD
jgi:hypothetical protein